MNEEGKNNKTVETIECYGMDFDIGEDNTATAIPTHKYRNKELFVPTEVNGIPVKRVKLYADMLKKVRYIYIPASIEEIEYDHYTGHAVEIEIAKNNPALFSDGKAVYTKDLSRLLFFFALDDEEYTILGGCREIAENAFYVSENLKRVIFPDGLTEIGDLAFAGCRGLTELNFPNGLSAIMIKSFRGCAGLKKVTFPPTLECIGPDAFCGCGKDLDICLPRSLKYLFGCSFPDSWTLTLDPENKKFIENGDLILSSDGQTAVCVRKAPANGVPVIPECVTQIAPYFCQRYDITKVILPKGLHTIGNYAFAFSGNLKEIDLENVRYFGDFVFLECESLERVRLKYNGAGTGVFQRCSGLLEAEIDGEVIEEEMFEECENLEKAVLKNTKVIKRAAFAADHQLENIILPEGLEELGEFALSCCGINELMIPKSVKRLGKDCADHIRKIHIFDNIGSDIDKDNNISGYKYNLYVHSAETGGIKYAVPVLEDDAVIGMFKGGADFDFKAYDSYFKNISEEDIDNISDKFLYAKMRLEYGYELDDETRRYYEEEYGRLTAVIVEYNIKDDDVERAMDPKRYRFTKKEDILPLIGLSAERGYTELTAMLMQLCQDK